MGGQSPTHSKASAAATGSARPDFTSTDGGWQDFSPPALRPALAAALDCFMENGYHGTTIRQVATRAGLSVPGLYHHFPSKQALLVALDAEAMSELWDRSSAALADGPQSVLERFDRLIRCLTLFHAHRGELAFIALSEIRSLEGSARTEHIAARDRQQSLLSAIIDDGVAAGIFDAPHPRETSRAITTMCTGVAQWYKIDGGLTPEELADRYGRLCRLTAGAAAGG
jgi:AcrR family transcriptional regulator